MNFWLGVCATTLLALLVNETSAQETLLMPVPSRAIYPGESLDGVDLATKLFHVSETSKASYVVRKEQLVRMEAVRTLAAGKPIPLRFIRTAEDVRKGQPAKAIYSSGSIEIQATLLPLTGGTVGQVLQARNTSSGNIVNALVMDGGTLLVVGK